MISGKSAIGRSAILSANNWSMTIFRLSPERERVNEPGASEAQPPVRIIGVWPFPDCPCRERVNSRGPAKRSPRCARGFDSRTRTQKFGYFGGKSGRDGGGGGQ